MIPNSNVLTESLIGTEYPSRTYKIAVSVDKPHRIKGYVDGLEAVRQSVYLILNTERYQFPIYSWDYGVELLDLIGQPIPYVMAEIPGRINEALTQDDRIEKAENFEFENNKGKLKVAFTVITKFGSFPAGLTVNDFIEKTEQPEPVIDPNDPELIPHKHIEVVQGDRTLVYCENVTSPYMSEDKKTYYYPYSFYY